MNKILEGMKQAVAYGRGDKTKGQLTIIWQAGRGIFCCPFCGSFQVEGNAEGVHCWLQCKKCLAQGPKGVVSACDTLPAITLWNKTVNRGSIKSRVINDPKANSKGQQK